MTIISLISAHFRRDLPLQSKARCRLFGPVALAGALILSSSVSVAQKPLPDRPPPNQLAINEETGDQGGGAAPNGSGPGDPLESSTRLPDSDLVSRQTGAQDRPARPVSNGDASTGRLESSAPRASEKPFLRRALDASADAEAARRFSEGTVGLVSAGVLFGFGFAAEGPDMTLSHALWVGSGIAAAGSLAALFVRTELERLRDEAPALGDRDLRRRWKRLADKAKVVRKTGAVVGVLFGGAAVTTGALVLSGELGSFDAEAETILGAALVSSGALTMGDSLVSWFVPTSVERGYQLIEQPTKPRFSVSAAPLPGGGAVSLSGRF